MGDTVFYTGGDGESLYAGVGTELKVQELFQSYVDGMIILESGGPILDRDETMKDTTLPAEYVKIADGVWADRQSLHIKFREQAMLREEAKGNKNKRQKLNSIKAPIPITETVSDGELVAPGAAQ